MGHGTYRKKLPARIRICTRIRKEYYWHLLEETYTHDLRVKRLDKDQFEVWYGYRLFLHSTHLPQPLRRLFVIAGTLLSGWDASRDPAENGMA